MACIFINFLLLNIKIKTKSAKFKPRPVILHRSAEYPVPGFGTNTRVTEKPIIDNVLYLLSNHL